MSFPDSALPKADPGNITHHLHVLTRDIGVRLAGSSGEQAAAEYIEHVFREQGARTSVEPFPVWERAVDSETLEIRIGGSWRAFPCSLFGGAPTTDGRILEAPLVFFDAKTGYDRPDLSRLAGKAVVHLGCHIETPEAYRRLMASDPAFLLFVDTRYPGDLPLADGLFPAYVREMGAEPTVNVAFMDAWEWNRSGADRARLRIHGNRRNSLSRNVIAEIPGTEATAGVLYVGGHHDTQAGTVGADDNAGGCAAAMELARIFTRHPLPFTIRLISFGAEEQLSVGSASYVRKHRADIRRSGRFMFNFDSFGSRMGWTEILANAPEWIEARLKERFHAHDIFYRFSRTVAPYTDQFPFAVAGTPGLWLRRCNCETGVFYHHRADDTIDRVCPREMARHIDAAADFLTHLAKAGSAPADWKIPETQRAEIAEVWESHYGGWEAPEETGAPRR